MLDNIGGTSTTLGLPSVDLSGYFQTADFASTLATYTSTGSLAPLALLSDITSALGSYYNQTEINTLFTSYYTQTEVSGLLGSFQTLATLASNGFKNITDTLADVADVGYL